MRWRDRRQSVNVEDRRGLSRGKMAVGGGLGTILLLLLVLIGKGTPSTHGNYKLKERP